MSHKDRKIRKQDTKRKKYKRKRFMICLINYVEELKNVCINRKTLSSGIIKTFKILNVMTKFCECFKKFSFCS